MNEIEQDDVREAERIIKELVHEGKNGKEIIDITTSQIRKFLTAVNAIHNTIQVCKEELSEDIANDIKYLKVKLAYQAGKDKNNTVRKFTEKTKMFDRIDKIGKSKKEFIKFAKFVEAIVAYHRYHGGRDR